MGIDHEILRSSVRVRLRKVYRLLLYFLLCLAFLFALSSFVFKLDQLMIKQVVILGNKNIETKKIFDLIGQELSGDYFGLYPKNNILIYPKEKMRLSLQRNFLRLKNAEIAGVQDEISITVAEREPSYLWCDEIDKPTLDRTCYYLDADGLAFALAPQFSGDVYLDFFGGNKRGGYMGRNILQPSVFHLLIQMKDALKKIIDAQAVNLGSLTGIYLGGDEDYDLMFTKGDSRWKLSFSLPSNLAGLVSESLTTKKLAAIFSSPFFKKELDNSNNELEYIDLRFGKKVFYKFH